MKKPIFVPAKIISTMERSLIDRYRLQLSDLKPNRSKGWISPHKPVMMLAVIELIGDGRISSNRIDINDRELRQAFANHWMRFAREGDDCNYVLPFFHLRSSAFWKLIPQEGMASELERTESVGSLKRMNELVQYARIDQELFLLLQHREVNALLAQTIMSTYFPDGELFSISAVPGTLIMSDPGSIVGWESMIRQQTVEAKTYTALLRNAAFRKYVMNAYGYRCAVSGLASVSISSQSTQRLVDACHIRPFSESETETISNGIVLTPTLHRAFDAGFFTIDDRYRIVLSSSLREQESPYMLRQFDGQQLLLPAHAALYPSLESLKWHRENRFIH